MFDWLKHGGAPEPRKGMPSPRLNEAEFKRRYRERFYDPPLTRPLPNWKPLRRLPGKPMRSRARARAPAKPAKDMRIRTTISR